MNPIWKKRLFWLLLLVPLMGAGPCQGVMLGGSEGLGTGSSAGGDAATDDDDSGSTSTSEDTTKFRPASLPPAVDEPSYAITASLSVSSGTATVSGTVTSASSGAIAASINVTVTQFTLSTASAEISEMPTLTVGQGDKLAVTATVVSTQCVVTGSNGQFQVAFSSFSSSTDKIDATVGCGSDAAGGSKDARLGAEPQVIYIHNTSTGQNTSGSTVSSLSFDIKFDESMDQSSFSPTNVTLTCNGLGTMTPTYSETSPATDNIAMNELTVSSAQTSTTDDSCTLTINTGLKNVSGFALTQAVSVSFTLQGTGAGGSSGGSGGTGGSTSTSLSVSSITTTATSGTALSGASITSINGVTVTFNQAPTTAPSTSNTTVVCTTAGSLPLTIATTSSTVSTISSTIKTNTADPCTLTIGTGTGLTSASTTAFTLAATHVFDTTPNATLTGQQSNSLFGSAVTMGDMDGTSGNEVIVGAPGFDIDTGNNFGRVTVHAIPSSQTGRTSVTPEATPVLTMTGSNPANPLLGTSVCYRSGATPVIVAGSPLYFVGGAARGAIETYNATGVLVDTITAPTAGTRFGESCAVGNFDGDSTRDILVGALESTSAGSASAYEGTTLLQSFSGDGSTSANFGQTVANLGDVNGDSIDDFAIGASSQSVAANTTGKVFFHQGNSSGLQGTANQTFTPSGATGLYGRAIAGGDVNGDGRSDMIVGAPGGGQIFVYHGSSSGLASSTTTQIGDFATGESSNGGIGRALATADFDEDGFADVAALKIPLSGGGTASGSVTLSIYRGSSSGLITTPFATITLGTSVANGSSNGSIATGDYNGDGNIDLAVGVAETTASSAGEVFLFTNEF